MSRTNLALAALGILPVLALHGLRHAHEVLLNGRVLDLVKALLLEVDLLAGGDDGAVDGGAAAAKGKNQRLRGISVQLNFQGHNRLSE